MRTTLDIDDRLLDEAREKARREGKTLTAVVEDALRAAVVAGPQDEGTNVNLPFDRESTGGFRSGRVFVSYKEFLADEDEIEVAEARAAGRAPIFHIG